MPSIYDLSRLDLENLALVNNEKKFRALQIYEWLYMHQVDNYLDMKNIKTEFLNVLANDYPFEMPKIILKQKDTDVIKYLFELSDGVKVEAVLMLHDYGKSICISSQVGCNMGCLFCESGKLKKIRNLTTGEMVAQIMAVSKEEQIKISHVVVMGIGEPLDNYDNVVKMIKIINDPKGLAIGIRHITVSTCGIVPKIYDLAKEDLAINLAISLHAPNDALRASLMPIAKVYPLTDLIDAVRHYLDTTGRRITFEYVMLEGINDQEKHALELAELLKGINGYVNLIPYNTTSAKEFKKSTKMQITKFYDILKKNKIRVTIRREFGSKVSAACGQLRANN